MAVKDNGIEADTICQPDSRRT